MSRKKPKLAQRAPTPYLAKSNPIPGTRHAEVAPLARAVLRSIARRTRRHAYIRSAYFGKQKIFFTYLWPHLNQKPLSEQIRRLKYIPCALELIAKSRNEPLTKDNSNRPGELLHRFAGRTRNGELFYVQIKEDRKSGRKEFMSVFPV